MENPALIVHFDAQTLLLATIASFMGIAGLIFWLLRIVSKMTIKGIMKEISTTDEKADRAYNHAEAAHTRVGIVESILIDYGVKHLNGKSK